MEYKDRITLEAGKRSGQPCIRGLRMTVGDILSYLAAGMSHEEILEDFPYLEEEDILAALAYAAEEMNNTLVVKAAA
ncbi:MAG: DUF433 domain-containing protein [Bacteroidetes bacterium]|jgi:uncharacterized protein (DUF433 family)|uniref:DUF433 domain-containing protein n=1 Tax=Phaeodactylibacter xiamenensis TaxID=1524460 RepID=UPI0024A9E749|nr:DUF433 domain-containing protein [Phaeodactylibacter xiamenensis]NBC09616.1 DUF433 domain-containing protein [Bacteroidota bacterium]